MVTLISFAQQGSLVELPPFTALVHTARVWYLDSACLLSIPSCLTSKYCKTTLTNGGTDLLGVIQFSVMTERCLVLASCAHLSM